MYIYGNHNFVGLELILIIVNYCQGFNWESSKKGGWYRSLTNSIPELSASGITHVWLPPPSQSVGPEGNKQSPKRVDFCFITGK